MPGGVMSLAPGYLTAHARERARVSTSCADDARVGYNSQARTA